MTEPRLKVHAGSVDARTTKDRVPHPNPPVRSKNKLGGNTELTLGAWNIRTLIDREEQPW